MDKKEQNDLEGLFERIRFKTLSYDAEGNYSRLQQRISNKVTMAKEKNFKLWRFVGLAASFALLIVTGLYLIHLNTSKNMIWYEITAVPDAKTKVILPDSSTVWLNANASLRYPQAFSDDKRNVQVTGDVMFEVKKDKKPFFVELDGLDIKVLGTVFNVVTDEEKDEIEITLLEGRIALFSHSNRTDQPDKILTPNERVIYSKSVINGQASPIRPEAITSWITGNFRFQGNTLAEITTELERAFHTKIQIENEAMKSKTFNAVFEEKETLDEILSILQISARYQIEKRKGVIYIN